MMKMGKWVAAVAAAVLWAGAAFAGTTVRVGHVLNPDSLDRKSVV